MDVSELKKIINICNKLNVKHIKFADVELTLGGTPMVQYKRGGKKGRGEKLAPSIEGLPTEDELLYWSSETLVPEHKESV
jgi:hypothetical protein